MPTKLNLIKLNKKHNADATAIQELPFMLALPSLHRPQNSETFQQLVKVVQLSPILPFLGKQTIK